MPTNQQSMVFLNRKAPYASAFATAGLDLMLTAAAFDQDITLVFSGDGVYQLLSNQDSTDIKLKNTAKAFPALSLYEIDNILVEENALESRGLSANDLLIPVKEISTEDLGNLLETADQVFNF